MQRLGSSLNLNVHLHVVVLDGVFVRSETENAVFHAAPPPSGHELDRVLDRVHRRVTKCLVRHGHVDTSAANGSRPSGDQPALPSTRGAERIGTKTTR